MTDQSSIVGRGARDGNRMFKEWFSSLQDVAEAKGPNAYVFVMGSMAEILQVFDLPMVFPEINSLQTAVKKQAQPLLGAAEDYGYSPDVCGYVKADVAVQLNDGKHPMGRIPKPTMAVLTNACNTYLKWAEIWERFYDTPCFTIDIPGTRSEGGASAPGSEDFKRDQRYILEQLKELIAFCEHHTNKSWDEERFKTALGHSNTMSAAWKRIIELNASKPTLFNALTEGTIYLGVSNAFRGTQAGADFFTDLVEEMEFKAAQHIGTSTEEEYRLAFIGVPCYPIFRQFNEFFTDWGGIFTASSYLYFAAGGANLGFQYDLDDPLESMAAGVLIAVRDAMDSMFYTDKMILDMIERFNLDGVVFHPIKSCRTVSTGLADSRRALMEKTDIPSLFIESDLMDKRVVSEAQLKNRIDAFFEGLASRRKRAAIAAT